MSGALNYIKTADSGSLSSLEFNICFWFGLDYFVRYNRLKSMIHWPQLFHRPIPFYNSGRGQGQTFVEFIWFNLLPEAVA